MVGQAAYFRPAAGARITVRLPWIEIAIVCAAYAIQIPMILNADLGWLLTVCEKMLAGDKLGVDVIELNPPLSVLMYMPAAYLGTVLPVAAHLIVAVMVLILAWGATLLTLQFLRPLLASAGAQRRARLTLMVVLMLVPGATFGQREHIAALLLLPFIAMAATGSLSGRQDWPRWLRLTAGTGAGLAMCIKPHFVLPAALPLLWSAARHKSLRPLLGLECWTAAAVVVAYFTAALIAYPEYFSDYPRWAAVAYLPLREPLGTFFGVDFLCALGAIALMLRMTCGNERGEWQRAAPWLLAAIGAFLSYLIQGKGFAYMRLPAVEYALLAACLAPAFLADDAWSGGHRSRGALTALAAIVPAMWLIPAPNSFAVLQEPIRAAAPAHPSMLAVGSNVGLGEPLVRKLGGQWASGAGSQLLTGGALKNLDRGHMDARDKALALHIVALERDRLRRDLQVRRPDVLLIDSDRLSDPFDWEAWARVDPAIARELDRNYRLLTRTRGVAIWLRRGHELAAATAPRDDAGAILP